MERKPLAVLPVHDYLTEYLNELHQNECIFDRFEVASSPDGTHYVTGSYDNNFVIHSAGSKSSETVKATSEPVKKKKWKKMTNFKKMTSKERRSTVAKMDFAKKSLHLAWHPNLNAVAVASLNKVYIYQAFHDDSL